MQMTKSEILRDYNLAKDKRAQVGVLAELNAVPVERIVEILMTALQHYKKYTTDELEKQVSVADATCKEIEAALEFVRESVG